MTAAPRPTREQVEAALAHVDAYDPEEVGPEVVLAAEVRALRAQVAEADAERLTLENGHRVALARELTAAAGCPLRDRYGFAARDADVLTVVTAVFTHPDDDKAVDAIGMANALGEIELAMASDTPTDEEYEGRIVAALRPLTENRRDAAVRGLS